MRAVLLYLYDLDILMAKSAAPSQTVDKSLGVVQMLVVLVVLVDGRRLLFAKSMLSQSQSSI